MNQQFDQKAYQKRMGTDVAATVGSTNQVPPEYDPAVSLIKYYNSSHCHDAFCPASLAEEQEPGYSPADDFVRVFEERCRLKPHHAKLLPMLVSRKSPDGIINHPITPWGDAEVLIGHVIYDQHGVLTALYGKPSRQSVRRAVDTAIMRLLHLAERPDIQAFYNSAVPTLDADTPVSNADRVEDRVPPFGGVCLLVSGHDRQPDNLLVCII